MPQPTLVIVNPAIESPCPASTVTRELALLALRADLAGREHRQLSALVRELVADTRPPLRQLLRAARQ